VFGPPTQSFENQKEYLIRIDISPANVNKSGIETEILMMCLQIKVGNFSELAVTVWAQVPSSKYFHSDSFSLETSGTFAEFR
jgi:hypothetical protein